MIKLFLNKKTTSKFSYKKDNIYNDDLSKPW